MKRSLYEAFITLGQGAFIDKLLVYGLVFCPFVCGLAGVVMTLLFL